MEFIKTLQNFFILTGFENVTLKTLFLVVFLPISVVYALGRGLNILKTPLRITGYRNAAKLIKIGEKINVLTFWKFFQAEKYRVFSAYKELLCFKKD